jgi:hypothetical protein
MFHHDYLFPGVTNQGREGSETELFRQVLRGDNRSRARRGVPDRHRLPGVVTLHPDRLMPKRLQAIEQVSHGSDPSGRYGRPMSTHSPESVK